MRNLLVVAYAFPPASVTGIHRTLAFVKYLEAAGWRSTVLSAENPIDSERDELLLSQIPAGTRVVRTRDYDLLALGQGLRWWRRSDRREAYASPPSPAGGNEPGGSSWRSLKHAVALRLRPPNWSPGWHLSTVRAGRRLLHEQAFTAIYSSGPPWTGHLVARRLAQEYDLPWVADFRDPWVANPFLDEPFDRLRRRNLTQEARVVAQADVVTCVLETMRQDLLLRHPERSAEDIVTISNGFDPASLAGLQVTGSPGTRGVGRPLTIVHAGQFYGPRRVEPLLAVMQEWLRLEPAMAGEVRLHLLGGSTVDAAALRVRMLAAGAGDWVTVEPEIPHSEALRRLAEATVLLLVGFAGSGEQFQMTGKIFEYLALRRPILAAAPPSCPIGEVLRATGVRHWIASPDDPAGLLQALRSMGEDWRNDRLAGPQSTSSLAVYDRREQTAQLAAVLVRAIAARAQGKPRPRPHGR